MAVVVQATEVSPRALCPREEVVATMSRIVHRSSITGEFITAEEAALSPDISVTEEVDDDEPTELLDTLVVNTAEELKSGYFVLDIEHDKYALPAMRAYADAVQDEFPELAQRVRDIVIRQSETF